MASPAEAADGLVVLAPMRIEVAAVRRGVRRSGTRVVHAGMGPKRAARTAARMAADPARAVLIAGFAGALGRELRPGELVVCDELRDAGGETVIRLPGAELVAGLLRRRGLHTRVGPIVSVERPASGGARGRLAERTGALAVDMESAWLARGAGEPGQRTAVVVRAILDTPEREIWRPLATLGGVRAAGRSLRRAVAVLELEQPAWT